MGLLLIRQIFVLLLICIGIYAWVSPQGCHTLPGGDTRRRAGCRCGIFSGIIIFYFVAVKEAVWMAAKIKQHLGEIEEFSLKESPGLPK